MSEEEIINHKIKAKEITFSVGTRLDEIVKTLVTLRNNGQLEYYAVFNNHVLYSVDVNLNTAYKECTNMTRQTWLKKYNLWQENNKNLVEAYSYNNLDLENWSYIGEHYINYNKLLEWNNLYNALHSNPFSYKLIKQCIQVIGLLSRKTSFEEVSNIIETFFNDDFNNELLLHIILNFASNGPDFYAYYKNDLNKYELKYISYMNKLNKKLQLKDDYESICIKMMNRDVKRLIIHDLNNKKLDEGIILVNNNNEFEGYTLGNKDYIKGIISNGYINITINNEVVNINGIEVLEEEKYYCDFLGLDIYLQDLNKDFRDEIYIEQEIDSIKDGYVDNKGIQRTLGV